MTLIVTNPDGSILERDRIRIHTTREEATIYGKRDYGYGHFRIQPYSTWRNTQIGKHEIKRIEIINRLRKFK